MAENNKKEVFSILGGDGPGSDMRGFCIQLKTPIGLSIKAPEFGKHNHDIETLVRKCSIIKIFRTKVKIGI